jgi:hypothetical protein
MQSPGMAMEDRAHVLSVLIRRPPVKFGTKRPQVQILSPRPVAKPALMRCRSGSSNSCGAFMRDAGDVHGSR